MNIPFSLGGTRSRVRYIETTAIIRLVAFTQQRLLPRDIWNHLDLLATITNVKSRKELERRVRTSRQSKFQRKGETPIAGIAFNLAMT
jgi:hypothetical protein